MCSDSGRRVNLPSMSESARAHEDWSCGDEELYDDCEPTKGDCADWQQPEECSRMLFFARCPPTLPQEELLQLFGKFGSITSFNLYRRWAKAKTSKGCGTVVYADKSSAAAAVAALNGKQSWPESESPMVVEWAQPSKLRQAAPSDDASSGAQPGSYAPTTKTPTVAGSHASATANSSSSNGTSCAHKAEHQLPRQQQLHKPGPHSSANTSNVSSSCALSASQRLVHEALTVQAAGLDSHSHTACSPLSEQEGPCTMPSHVVPMLSSLMLDLPPAISGNAAGMSHASTPGNFMRQQCAWRDSRDSAASLPQMCPPIAVLPAGYGGIGHSSLSAEQACLINSYPLPSLSNSSNIWSNPSNAAAAAAAAMPDALLLQQQHARAASATAAMQSMSGPLLHAPVSAAAAAAAAAAAVPTFYSSSCLWPQEDRSASQFYSAEHAFSGVLCSGSLSAASAAAAAAGHSGPVLPHSSSTSGALPSLLEVIPAMSWLQLQQIEQQNAVDAAAATAVAADPTNATSGSFVGCGSCNNAAEQLMAAQAAASLQEVNLDLNPQAARVLVGSLELVTARSGANVRVNSIQKRLKLQIRGSAAQIESACATLRLLLL